MLTHAKPHQVKNGYLIYHNNNNAAWEEKLKTETPLSHSLDETTG